MNSPPNKKSASRRRRGSSRSGERSAKTEVAASGHGDEAAGKAGRKKGRRRRRRGAKHSDAPSRVLTEDKVEVDLERDTEAPLTPEEVAVLREHFRFLQVHRKELRLKLNAVEDLLLNGAREPEHRGVCQHLLRKVDRSSVLAAAERLEPEAAARLLAGIIRFAGEIEYVLVFLEKIKLSSTPKEATSALSQGLQRIDFDGVSNAQMRRVLNLIVELFDPAARPQILMGMLESQSFRTAFDRSIQDLPEPLARLVVPLRVAQAVVLHGKPNRFGSESLRQGVRMLLDVDDRTLLRSPFEVRRRLFDFGIQACGGPEHSRHRSLKTLLRGFPQGERVTSDACMALARHLLAAGDEAEAKKILTTLAEDLPDFHLPQRWLASLEAERIDGFAFRESPASGQDALGHHRRQAAVGLESMRPVWLFIGSPDHLDTLEGAARILTDVAIPGVANLVATGTSEEGTPYLAVVDPGPALGSVVSSRKGLGEGEAIRIGLEVAGILSALAAAGVLLPDVGLERFARDGRDSVWLVDLIGARPSAPEEAQAAHLTLAREFCTTLLEDARRFLPTESLLNALADARSCASLVRSLAAAQLPLRR